MVSHLETHCSTLSNKQLLKIKPCTPLFLMCTSVGKEVSRLAHSAPKLMLYLVHTHWALHLSIILAVCKCTKSKIYAVADFVDYVPFFN